MAEIVEVRTAKPKVEGVTLKLAVWEAKDMMIFIENWYKGRGFGYNQHTTNSVWTALRDGVEGKTSLPVPAPF